MHEILFQPLQVKGYAFRNRIVMPPMVVNRGIHQPAGWEWYARHARGGAALVIVEAADSLRFGKEYTVENLKPLVQGIHQGGALAAIQIFPGWRGQKTQPADLSLEEIQALLEQYRLAAEVCLAAGFDGIEPHGAHGFLLNQFFSPEQNRRTDAYGGSIEGRMRLALEILALLQPLAARQGALLLYRHSPVRAGYGIPESLALAKALVGGGLDLLDLSPSSKNAPGDRSAPFMGLGIPVIAVNELDQPARALEVLHERRADLVAVGRGLIADPDWPIKVQEDRLQEIVQCQYCDDCYACLDRGEEVVCSEWR